MLKNHTRTNDVKEKFIFMLNDVCTYVKKYYSNKYSFKDNNDAILISSYYSIKDNYFTEMDVYRVKNYDSYVNLFLDGYDLEDVNIGSREDKKFSIFLPFNECTINVVVQKEDCIFMVFDSDNNDKCCLVYSLKDNEFLEID